MPRNPGRLEFLDGRGSRTSCPFTFIASVMLPHRHDDGHHRLVLRILQLHDVAVAARGVLLPRAGSRWP